MKKDKNFNFSKTANKTSLPYSEICDSAENEEPLPQDYFDGDVQVLMGNDIDLKNAKIEKTFDFSKSN